MTRSMHRILLLALLVSVRASAAGAQTATSALDDYYRAVSDYFDVGLDEVRIISEWRISAEGIPVVFFLARSAGISADAAAAERSRGRSWFGLMRRYGVQVTSLHVSFSGDAVLGPLSSLYRRMDDTPRGAWNRLDLTDVEVTTLINVRMLSSALGVSPARIVDAAENAGTFIGVQRVLGGG